MSAPKLLYAGPNGQSSVRAIFDQPMRQLGQAASEDPTNPANWAVGGGLPAIVSVVRTSNVEFELVLASPAPVAGGYTVTVANTVQSAATGESMNTSFVTATFAVTTADLVVSSVSWLSDSELDITFSEPIAQILFDAYSEVARFETVDHSAREPSVIGISQSGASFRITLEAPGTAGARYAVTLNREVFVSDATNVTLRLGDEVQQVWGQGLAPAIVDLTITEDSVEVTSSEVLGTATGTQGWPLSHGLYQTDIGSLNPAEALELGSSPAVLTAPGANLIGLSGETATFSVLRVTRSVTTGASFLSGATSYLGAGTETVGATTVLNKTAGDPFEVVFSGGTESLARAGRQLTTELDISFTAGPTSFPLAVFTLLNTQVSVVIEKTATNMAILKLYRGNRSLGRQSAEFDPTAPFTFAIIDATSDSGGFLAVEVNGEVMLGARSQDLLDSAIIQPSVGATAVAVTLGSPAAPAEVFSVEFVSDLAVSTYLGTGFLGVDSKDLLSFSGSVDTAVVAAAASPPASPGYAGTGKAAFGVHAEYMPNLAGNAMSAIQVTIGLNTQAQPAAFTGSATLTTGNEQVLDQVLFDQSYVLVGGEEIIVVFLNPICWAGTLMTVSLTIGGVDYSTTVPVIEVGLPQVVSSLAPQPSKWFHQRLSNAGDATNLAAFGPAVIIQTP